MKIKDNSHVKKKRNCNPEHKQISTLLILFFIKNKRECHSKFIKIEALFHTCCAGSKTDDK